MSTCYVRATLTMDTVLSKSHSHYGTVLCKGYSHCGHNNILVLQSLVTYNYVRATGRTVSQALYAESCVKDTCSMETVLCKRHRYYEHKVV